MKARTISTNLNTSTNRQLPWSQSLEKSIHCLTVSCKYLFLPERTLKADQERILPDSKLVILWASWACLQGYEEERMGRSRAGWRTAASADSHPCYGWWFTKAGSLTFPWLSGSFHEEPPNSFLLCEESFLSLVCCVSSSYRASWASWILGTVQLTSGENILFWKK